MARNRDLVYLERDHTDGGLPVQNGLCFSIFHLKNF